LRASPLASLLSRGPSITGTNQRLPTPCKRGLHPSEDELTGPLICCRVKSLGRWLASTRTRWLILSAHSSAGKHCFNTHVNSAVSSPPRASIPYPPITVNVRFSRFCVASTKFLFKGERSSSSISQSELKIVEYPDPILRPRNKRVNMFDESLKNLVAEMFILIMDGVWLSAPQIGINVELMVFNPVGEHGEGEEIVLVNPQIKRFSRKIVPFNEGCLSFLGIYADVERPDALQVGAQDITGGRFEVNLTGLHARGILFFDRMSDEVLETVRAELEQVISTFGTFGNNFSNIPPQRALEKKYEETTGLPSPERIDKRRRKKEAFGFGKQ
ncbi:peptide deformylase 1B, partial [Striga asiatica]